MVASHSATPRTVMLCGPYLSGKTSLFEALLAESGALQRHAAPNSGFSLGDAAPEAKAHEMSTEMNIATADYLGQEWTFIDCPGSLDLIQETRNAMQVADLAVVVAEPDPAKVVTLDSYIKLLEEADIPHIIFINKFDKRDVSARALMEAFQAVSSKPLVLREIPIREGDQVTGFVDLVSERAYHWEEGKPSSLIKLPDEVADREAEARTEMLEHLADFDDDLLEKLLEDIAPSTEEVYNDLADDLANNLVVPVFFGAATNMNGIHRLMKALRHEGPDVEQTDIRLGVEDDGEPHLKVFKTLHAGHAGKISVARVLNGTVKATDTFDGERPASLVRIFGKKTDPVQSAGPGQVVGLTKMDSVQTGDLLTPSERTAGDGTVIPPKPLFSLAIKASSRGDDVKLPEHLKKLFEEDPSLSAEFDEMSGCQVLSGQGEMHLRLCLEKLKNRTGIDVETSDPVTGYRETIRKPVEARYRHKKQSGGHGEFGEVVIKIAPRGRGEGFEFRQEIHGGSVPKQYFSAIEAGIQDTLVKGQLGYPVVDVEAVLLDGKAHSVDSSEMAFRKAGAQAMRDALSDAGSVKLEPINQVLIYTPDAFISGIQKIVTGRRGQILGFESREGWPGWNEVNCQIPAAEMHGMINELRSATMGAASFEAEFDHLQEQHS